MVVTDLAREMEILIGQQPDRRERFAEDSNSPHLDLEAWAWTLPEKSHTMRGLTMTSHACHQELANLAALGGILMRSLGWLSIQSLAF